MQTVQNCEVMKKTEQFKVCKLYNSFKNVSIAYLWLGNMMVYILEVLKFFKIVHEKIILMQFYFCTLIWFHSVTRFNTLSILRWTNLGVWYTLSCKIDQCTLVHYSMGFYWWFSLWKIFSKMQTNGNLGKSFIYSENLFSELIFYWAAVFLISKLFILFHNLNSLTSTVLYQSKSLNSKENQTFLFHNLKLISTILY